MVRVFVKTGAAAAVGPRVIISSISLVWSVFYSINLVLTPLLAYMSEDMPWHVPPPPPLVYSPFDVFVTNMTSFLQAIYNNDTFPHANSEIFLHSAATYDMRLRLTLPPSITDCQTTMLQFPGHFFYGRGIREYVCAYLSLNTTARSVYTATSMCQHDMMVGLPLTDGCLWITPVESESYVVDYAHHIRPGPAFAWFKLMYRITLTVAVLWVIWTRYYAHYIPLMQNLRHFGLRDDELDDGVVFTKLVVYLGDPTYFVLSHPLVTTAMVFDFWLSAVNIGIAMGDVSQFQQLWPFVRSCVYASRGVWSAYLTMLCLSLLVKQKRWEHNITSVDPGILAIAIVIYVGPIACLIQNSALVIMFQSTFMVSVPSTEQWSSIEVFPSILNAVVFTAAFPLTLSVAHAWCNRRHSPDLTTRRGSHYASVQYNDVKLKLLWFGLAPFLTPKTRAGYIAHIGGTVQRLFAFDPGYKKLPFFSLRASDCFVLCYDVHGELVTKARLSLVTGLDRQDRQTSALTIHLCPAVHGYSVGIINDHPCQSVVGPTDGYPYNSQWLHLGAAQCQWVL
ncbi:Aste57867_10942 [Aphanomyces stellatus]|uniref:Aste57867_10942 protein n=1 Tax=Aphanomyces stellatus TaxID=120398 RepID=A0A485KSC7_9STRA|nr:hypothetical protein As57867_010902 [Aphanomyces stellatus]VFT87810.1 Aste57867_10942 [Aphanomyces stellatus]